jgi:hypothetical protein
MDNDNAREVRESSPLVERWLKDEETPEDISAMNTAESDIIRAVKSAEENGAITEYEAIMLNLQVHQLIWHRGRKEVTEEEFLTRLAEIEIENAAGFRN